MAKKKDKKEKPEDDGDSAVPKKTPIVVHIVVFLLITAAAAGAGFGASMFLKSTETVMEKQAHNDGSQPMANAGEQTDEHGESLGESQGEETGEKAGHEKPSDDNGQGEGVMHAYATPLEPILTNLAAPANMWIRVELAAVAKDKLPDELLEKIHQDLFAYMRTVKLHHIEGPSGFINLKAELTDRAATRSGGAVKKVLVRTLVIE